MRDAAEQFTDNYLGAIMIYEDADFLVYTMGKVGSNSVKGALDSWLGRKSRHLHDVVKRGDRLRYRPALARDNDELYELFKSEGRVFNILTMVREPIKKNISQFFQDLDRRYKIDPKSLRYSELLSMFLNMDKHFMPIDWFDVNILGNFVIDVFNDAHDRISDVGWIYRNGRASLLCLKSESDNFAKWEALSIWLNDDGVPRIVNKNVSGEKHYADVYRRFLDEVRLPEEYVVSLYANAYTKFFYPEIALEKIVKRWC